MCYIKYLPDHLKTDAGSIRCEFLPIGIKYRTTVLFIMIHAVEEVLRPYMGMMTYKFLFRRTGKPRLTGLIPAAVLLLHKPHPGAI